MLPPPPREIRRSAANHCARPLPLSLRRETSPPARSQMSWSVGPSGKRSPHDLLEVPVALIDAR
ncbi:hypothetical protein X740_05095 [Mesorhizobium sp. LNHC221B00]|nr:hypothetical protein X740_05095 [Mesorhizobium sp. LNHC221B00]